MVRKITVGDEKLMGRFETLCAFHTPIDSIASDFGVSKDTLKAWVLQTYKEEFSFVYKKYMEHGNALLNKSAVALAQKNAQMNIWLRKQWMGERDPDKEIVKNNEVDDIEATPDVFDKLADLLSK